MYECIPLPKWALWGVPWCIRRRRGSVKGVSDSCAVRRSCAVVLQVYIVDPACLSTPGPRVVDAVELLSRILHPEHVDQPAPPGAVLKLSGLEHGQRCRPRQLRNYFKPFN